MPTDNKEKDPVSSTPDTTEVVTVETQEPLPDNVVPLFRKKITGVAQDNESEESKKAEDARICAENIKQARKMAEEFLVLNKEDYAALERLEDRYGIKH